MGYNLKGIIIVFIHSLKFYYYVNIKIDHEEISFGNESKPFNLSHNFYKYTVLRNEREVYLACVI